MHPHPNLLHLTRSCAKWRNGFILVACLALSTIAVSVACATTPPPRAVAPRNGVVTELMALGDTLSYGLSWPVGKGATGYLVTVRASATNGTWSGLPTNAAVSGLATTFKASAIPWDSVTFTWVTKSTNTAGVSKDSLVVIWTKKRLPSAPPSGTVDSTGAVGTLTLPGAFILAVGQSRVVCAFKQFSNGAIAQWTVARQACDSIYMNYVPQVNRQLVSAGQQAHTDSLAVTCVTWQWVALYMNGSTGSCSPSITVTGILTTGMLEQVPDATRVARSRSADL